MVLNQILFGEIVASQPPYFQYTTQDSFLMNEVNPLESVGHIGCYTVL